MTKSLKKQGAEISDPVFQLHVLQSRSVAVPPFKDNLHRHGIQSISPSFPEVLQMNLGYMCNQVCKHCHVDAGPDRKEKMSQAIMSRCLQIVDEYNIKTVDMTGGAPEMHPDFFWFLEQLEARDVHVIDRCNLTILVAGAKYRRLPEIFARMGVEVISSLPHFAARRTDSQRGDGVFEKSIKALRLLNSVGYGQSDRLKLNLVYNPNGAFLPSDQNELEDIYKKKLKQKHGVVFNNLYTITNMPIARFLDYLLQSGNYDTYMTKLFDAFNPASVEGLMCRNTLSVGYTGEIYDCDFNQMLDIKVRSTASNVMNFDMAQLLQRDIALDMHCYGCTAGAGSSCGGATT